MNKLLSLSLLCWFCLNPARSKAQSFTTINDTMFYTVSAPATFRDSIHIGPANVTFSWQIIACDFPADWLPAMGFCDNTLCRILTGLWPATGATYNTMSYPASDTGVLYFAIDLLPAGTTTGCHYVTARLRNIAIPSDSTTETWRVCYYGTGAITGVSTKTTDHGISIYPNPVNNELNVRFDANAGIYNIYVCDLLGKVVAHEQCSSGNTKIMLAGIPEGMYFARFANKQGAVISTQKFIKE